MGEVLPRCLGGSVVAKASDRSPLVLSLENMSPPPSWPWRFEDFWLDGWMDSFVVVEPAW